jgi:hypothetical protein
MTRVHSIEAGVTEWAILIFLTVIWLYLVFRDMSNGRDK